MSRASNEDGSIETESVTLRRHAVSKVEAGGPTPGCKTVVDLHQSKRHKSSQKQARTALNALNWNGEVAKDEIQSALEAGQYHVLAFVQRVGTEVRPTANVSDPQQALPPKEYQSQLAESGTQFLKP